MDENSIAIASNNAANQMFALSGSQSLKGRSIAGYLPLLADALQLGSHSGELKTAAAPCGHRENGEFFADIWFSSYTAGDKRRLAAIVVDSSEEMREHEEENLRLLRRGNLIAVSAVAHEVRNLSSDFRRHVKSARRNTASLSTKNFRLSNPCASRDRDRGVIGLRSRGRRHPGSSAPTRS